ncbi:MAG TPA: SDR family NAD(P)-dependent oxidoreductase [Chloroflexota bacterium]
MGALSGKIAVVAGATRGAGRGIARGLGEAGATVYCTGRSIRGYVATPGRPETIDETAEMVTAAGGKGIAAQVDHTDESQVQLFFDRVQREQDHLDILVNDIWGGDQLTEWGKPFWELDVEKGLTMLQRAVHAHIITSRHGVPLMVGTSEPPPQSESRPGVFSPSSVAPVERGGLIVEVTDGDFLGYRGNLLYDLAKLSTIRLAYGMAKDLRGRGITALAVTPGFLRSEAMLDHFGVTEATWRDAIAQDRHFAESETPTYIGRAVTALAADPNVGEKAGKVWSTGKLAREYGFIDKDGRQPDFGSYFDEAVNAILTHGGPHDDDERALLLARYDQLDLDPRRADDAARMAARLWPQ